MKKIFLIFKNNKLNLAKAVVIDFIFYIFFMIITFLFSDKFYQKFETLNNTISNVFIDNGTLPTDVLNKLSNVSNILNEMLWIIILYLFLVFLVFGLFQGLIWLISKNIIKNKSAFNNINLDYILDFYLLNLIWFVLLGCFIYGVYKFFNLETNMLFIVIPFVLLFYFWNISLSSFVLKNKVIGSFVNCFNLGRKIILIIPFIFLVVSVFLIGFLSNLNNNSFISIILLLLLLLVVLIFRVYLLILVEKYAGDML